MWIHWLSRLLNQGMVEDFTGRGIADLREGIIRTPLPPTETFLDGGFKEGPAIPLFLSCLVASHSHKDLVCG